jgi:tetratricopeptide (TPR) repeat protein
MRIQAVHLRQTHQPPLVRQAVELIDRLLADYPDSAEAAAAYWCKAGCLEELGDLSGAITAYRLALRAERLRPRVRTVAYLDLGKLAARAGRADLYPEVLSALDEFGGDELFPQHQYEAAALRAVVLEELGDLAAAREFARRALEAAVKTHTGLRYHPDLLLLENPELWLHDRISKLAAA